MHLPLNLLGLPVSVHQALVHIERPVDLIWQRGIEQAGWVGV